MWPFKRKPPEPPKNWKYVGRTTGSWTSQPGNRDIGSCTAMFYMTDEGERKVEYVFDGQVNMDTLNNGRDSSNQLLNAKVWLKGGPFPKNFKSETDVLGEMLNRLVNEKLGFTDDGKGDK